MNSIRVIRPYKYYGQWVFDDEQTGLVKEAFVGGADTMLDMATADIPNADKGCLMLFSESLFPGAQLRLQWVREEGSGNVYLWKEQNQEGWLCPALFKYFDVTPKEIHVQVKSI